MKYILMFYGGEFTLTASCENSLKKENILYIPASYS